MKQISTQIGIFRRKLAIISSSCINVNDDTIPVQSQICYDLYSSAQRHARGVWRAKQNNKRNSVYVERYGTLVGQARTCQLFLSGRQFRLPGSH